MGAAALAAVAALATSGLSSEVFRTPAPLPRHVSAGPAAVAVVDGGTLRVGGQVMRLRGVDAPARGEVCGGGWDCGGAAAAALAAMVRDRGVDCQLTGRDAQNRPFAACEAGGADLGRAIVVSGWARAGADTPDMAALEQQARNLGNGLWAGAAR